MAATNWLLGLILVIDGKLVQQNSGVVHCGRGGLPCISVCLLFLGVVRLVPRRDSH